MGQVEAKESLWRSVGAPTHIDIRRGCEREAAIETRARRGATVVVWRRHCSLMNSTTSADEVRDGLDRDEEVPPSPLLYIYEDYSRKPKPHTPIRRNSQIHVYLNFFMSPEIALFCSDCC